MNEQQFENAIWWIDRMALETVKEYRIWESQTEPGEMEEHYERMMGRMGEIVATINLIARSRFGTGEARAKIEKTIEWLNGHMAKHQICIRLRG